MNTPNSSTHRNQGTQHRFSRLGTRLAIIGMLGMSLTSIGGCETAGEGLFTGAAVGALTGLAIGSINGEAGEGAAVGAILGGVAGSVIGDQNDDRRSRSVYRSRPHPHRHSHTHRHSHPDRCDDGYHYDDWWND